jgi:tetratricopeptide (TPR) repeat protein
MLVRRLAVVSLLLAAIASAGDKPGSWLEVRSGHFVVVSDAGEKQARNVADQLERMRAVFHRLFPASTAGPPLTVLAVKNEKAFRTLEPESYLGKGKLQLAGYFLRTGDEDLILLRLDAGGDHPYATVYHEYTHFLARNMQDWLPVWVNEGLAEFYQNTEIRDKDVLLGEPSPGNLYLLHERRLLPLTTLFAVDHTSPYYHEQDKGSVFYAEAWALTHYLISKDFQEKTTRLTTYLDFSEQKVDPTTAAVRAFGDLNALQRALETYVSQPLGAFKLKTPVMVNDADFKLRPLPSPQADALRAKFLAYNGRTGEARTLLESVLHDDPNSATAHEVMGYLEFRQRHLAEARKWYEQAVELNSQSYLAHYYYATIAMNTGHLDPDAERRVETSLRTAIRLNPGFAPAYDRLAIFWGTRHENLEEASRMETMAVQIDPDNVGYRLNAASILMARRRGEDALRVVQGAAKVAKSPQDVARVERAMQMAERYQAAQKVGEEPAATAQSSASESHGPPATVTTNEESSPPMLKHATESSPSTRQYTAMGIVSGVRCSAPATLDFQLESRDQIISLHADNYYKVQFSTNGIVPPGELKPCTQLEGRRARVEYLESTSGPARLSSVELQK